MQIIKIIGKNKSKSRWKISTLKLYSLKKNGDHYA